MSDPGELLLSVVIPSHNRRDPLLRTLEALRSQTLPADRFEVIVVLDAATDDSAAALDRLGPPYRFRHMPCDGRGPAAARNTGARAARAPRLVFLDDDILADPGFLEAHLAADQRDAVIVGQSAPAVVATGWFGAAIGGWWAERFRAMGRPGYRFGYKDVMSGNLSLPRDLFRDLGGFDAGLMCREDYELGYRLVRAGARIAYAAEARGLHHDASTPSRNLARAWDEGGADVQVLRKHPELFPWLSAASLAADTPGSRVLRLLCLRAPAAGRATLALTTAVLPLLERASLRRIWHRLSDRARMLSYHLGVAAEAGSFAALLTLREAHRRAAVPPVTLEADLLDGAAAAVDAVAAQRPDALILRVGDTVAARLHAEPGLEPLAARHVEAMLAEAALAWAPAEAAAGQLLPLPPRDPDLPPPPAGAVTPAVSLGEVDLDGWRFVPRSAGAGFPLTLLIRHAARPLGWVTFPAPPSPGAFWPALRRAVLGDAGIRRALLRHRLPPAPPEPPSPRISVVVCTRDRTETLRRCLGALTALDYPSFEIVIVDNAPTSKATRDLVAATPQARYVREDRPGLDWARNRGIAEARADIIAFTDDDTMADRHWLTGIAQAFAEPSVDFVTGLTVPMKLDTEARNHFENVYGGMGKGFDAVTRDPRDMWPHDLLWASALGVGANMAFRRRAFERAGRFDPALDVGTATRGGGDIEMFHRALARGSVHVYQPAAMVWHEHRADLDGLRRQLADNGSGFACYLLACWRNRTVPRMAILRFAGRAWIWDWQVKRLIRPGLHRRSLVWAEISGLLRAPRLWRAAQAQARALAGPAPEAPPARDPGR